MATEIQVGTAAMGGLQAPTSYRPGYFNADLALSRFRQFVEVQQLGQKKGILHSIRKWSDFASAGGAVAETATMPLGTCTVTTATVVISEYGQAITFSQLAALTMDEDPFQICASRAQRDAAIALENAVHKAMCGTSHALSGCLVKYVGTATAGGVTTVDGSATVTNTSALNLYHWNAIRDYLIGTLYAAPFDAQGHYAAILSVKAARNVKNDASFEAIKMYANPESLLEGEVGMLDGIRAVECVANMDNSIGSGTLTGEAIFFGAEPCYEVVVQGEQTVLLQDGQGTDYGRIKGVGWYYVGGFKANFHNSYGRLVHWTSKA